MAQPQTVLIVDDDQRLLDCLAAFLRGHRFAVATAKNGLNGFASFISDPPDWIITDIEMPQLNGLEMVQRIRATDPLIKVIYTSGAVEKHGALLYHELRQFNAWSLSKPFSFNQVLDLLTDNRGVPLGSGTPGQTTNRPSRVISGGR